MKRIMEIQEVINILETHKKAIDALDPVTITVDTVVTHNPQREEKKVIRVHCYYGDEYVKHWFDENRKNVKLNQFADSKYYQVAVDLDGMCIFALLSEGEREEFLGGERNQ